MRHWAHSKWALHFSPSPSRKNFGQIFVTFSPRAAKGPIIYTCVILFIVQPGICVVCTFVTTRHAGDVWPFKKKQISNLVFFKPQKGPISHFLKKHSAGWKCVIFCTLQSAYKKKKRISKEKRNHPHRTLRCWRGGKKLNFFFYFFW